MKKLLFLTIIMLSIVPSTSLFAQESGVGGGVPTSETVAQRCSLTQNYLNKTLKSRDLKARVDRLQAYRYIYQRLDIYVGRLERNGQPGADELRRSMEVFGQKTEEFKNDYESYDTTRDLVANYEKCSANPDEFLQYVNAMRIARQKVAKDVSDIHVLLDHTIMDQLEALRLKFLQIGGTGTQ